MSKSRNHKSETEQLREELRNLKSENRHLRKQLNRASKSLFRLADLEEIAHEEGVKEQETFVLKIDKCSVCNAESTKVGGRTRTLHRHDCPERKRK